jgi:TetR/AcrR family transcriptional regulator, lmrAB and yxaGH operons repressor
MPRTSNARAQLISSAAKLFQRQGYHGTGLTQILTESGAPKGSFYHHFPSGKEELAETVMHQAGKEISGLVMSAFDRSDTFIAGVDAVSLSIADWFSRSDFAAGCPITSVMLETVPASSRLGTASKEVFREWSGVVTSAALRDGYDMQTAKSLGQAMVIALEGAWIVARAERDPNAFLTAANMVKSLANTPPK